jgi:RNA polymerase sigma factor (sigma-70 family)
MDDAHRMAYEFVCKYSNLLRSMAKRQARAAGRKGWRTLADELYSEAIERAPSVAANWEEYRGSLYTYMRKSLGWYMHKIIRKRRLEADALSTASLDERSYDAAIGSELEHSEEVYYLLQDLDETERAVMVAHTVGDLTFEQIAEQLGMAKSTVRLRYHSAIKKARAMRDGNIQQAVERTGDR